MAAKIQVCARCGNLGKFGRLMIDHENRKGCVKSGKQFGRCVARLLCLPDPVGIFPACQIKFVVDADHLILQQVNLRAVQKLTEPAVCHALLFRLKRKACQNLLIEIVIAVAGVCTIAAL